MIKTRLQLDGELQQSSKIRVSPTPAASPGPTASGAAGAPPAAAEYKKVYNNAFDALRKTWRFEGISGVQRGLSAAYAYQIMLFVSKTRKSNSRNSNATDSWAAFCAEMARGWASTSRFDIWATERPD